MISPTHPSILPHFLKGQFQFAQNWCHCTVGHSVIIMTPAFLENTLPQDLQTLNSSNVAMRLQVYDPYFTYCKNPTLVNYKS
ncbi:MAG: hypothetical protein OEL81_06060 [Nitrosopumilus sp.]|nr:hypothetical protein [Nitrosopumilus sp.]